MMTICEILKELRRCKPTANVYFDFCGCAPTDVDSSRGSYDKPAIGWMATGYSGSVSSDSYPTVESLIGQLEAAIQPWREYSGWKGGEYSYTEDDVLYVDNTGDWSGTVIVRVEDRDYEVFLHTQKEED